MRIGKRLADPVVVDGLAESVQRAVRDIEVEALVAAAPTTPAAWESLGPRTRSPAERARDARAEELSAAMRERWAAVTKGRAVVAARRAAGEPITGAIRARFLELHQQRLELRWALDRCVFVHPDADAERRRMAVLCDEEVSDALGSEWPGPEVQAALHALNAALEEGDVVPVTELCLEAVAAAVAQAYPGGEA